MGTPRVRQFTPISRLAFLYAICSDRLKGVGEIPMRHALTFHGALAVYAVAANSLSCRLWG